jgi:hypothetical protein
MKAVNFLASRPMACLIALTATVCGVELATLVRCLASGQEPATTALVLGAFHLGYLAANWGSHLPLRALNLTAGAALTILGLCCWLLPQGGIYAVPLGVALTIFNAAAQALRRALKKLATPTSPAKNTAKAVGMALGGVLGASTVGSAALMIPGAALLVIGMGFRKWPVTPPTKRSREAPRSRLLLWGELLHHAHYFAYAYTFWYLAPALIGFATGLWFLLGWLAYFIAEFAWRERRRSFLPRIMAVGHFAVAGLLAVMPFLPAVGVLAAWFATGIGGGTAYMLGNSGSQRGRERFEDIGHVAGCVVGALAAAVTGRTMSQDAATTTLVAAGLAVATAGVFWATPHRTRHEPPEKANICV